MRGQMLKTQLPQSRKWLAILAAIVVACMLLACPAAAGSAAQLQALDASAQKSAHASDRLQTWRRLQAEAGSLAPAAPEPAAAPATPVSVDAPAAPAPAAAPLTTVLLPCCAALSSVSFKSDIPMVIINTAGLAISDEPKIHASFCTCGVPGGDWSGAIAIEVRGSSSARDNAKKSFAFETKAENGSSLDAPVFGFPSGDEWVLYGPENDKTLGMRNWLAYNLAHQMGRYASRTLFCELFLVQDGKPLGDAHYWGVYMGLERIKRGKHRVAVAKLNPDEDLSGGYIVKYENNNIKPGNKMFDLQLSRLTMLFQYPTGGRLTDAVIMWIQKYMNDFEAALIGPKFTDAEAGYRKFIDVPSFVDYFLATEITKNPDGYRGSTYMSKDRGAPLVMGPLWDYNEAFGLCCGYPIEGYQTGGRSTGASGGSAISPDGWRFNICDEPRRCQVEPRDGTSQWFRRLWQDDTFQKACAARWQQLRSANITDATISASLAQLAQQLAAANQRNFNRWRDQVADTINYPAGGQQMFTSEVQTLGDWTIRRLGWLDGAFAGISGGAVAVPAAPNVNGPGGAASGDGAAASLGTVVGDGAATVGAAGGRPRGVGATLLAMFGRR